MASEPPRGIAVVRRIFDRHRIFDRRRIFDQRRIFDRRSPIAGYISVP